MKNQDVHVAFLVVLLLSPAEAWAGRELPETAVMETHLLWDQDLLFL